MKEKLIQILNDMYNIIESMPDTIETNTLTKEEEISSTLVEAVDNINEIQSEFEDIQSANEEFKKNIDDEINKAILILKQKGVI